MKNFIKYFWNFLVSLESFVGLCMTAIIAAATFKFGSTDVFAVGGTPALAQYLPIYVSLWLLSVEMLRGARALIGITKETVIAVWRSVIRQTGIAVVAAVGAYLLSYCISSVLVSPVIDPKIPQITHCELQPFFFAVFTHPAAIFSQKC